VTPVRLVSALRVSAELTVTLCEVLPHAMENRKSFKIFAPEAPCEKESPIAGNRQVILVPVIFLAVYYLFCDGPIVDRT